jgi:hypothetical protein
MRLRAFLLASTLLTGAGLARAEPVRLDPAALDALAAGGLRVLVGSTTTQGSAFAAGPVARAQTDASNSSESDGRTARLSARTRSRAAVALWPR